MGDRTCAGCGADSAGTYCSSRCKWALRPRVACASCGGPTGWAVGARVSTATCNPCRRQKPTYRPANMAARGMVERWSCAGCGVECERPATKGQRPKWCAICRNTRKDWVPAGVRRQVYERDDWTCGICLEPVKGELIGSLSEWRPSLDHVVPRSRGGSNEPSNLRLAHFWCNTVRNDERSYTDADFRAA